MKQRKLAQRNGRKSLQELFTFPPKLKKTVNSNKGGHTKQAVGGGSQTSSEIIYLRSQAFPPFFN